MGRLKKTVLGRVSGTVGDVVFRNRDGKNIVSSKPASFKTPDDPASIERRARFKLTSSFSGAIRSVEDLRAAWNLQKPSFIKTHNAIFRANYPHITPSGITGSALIVPEFGFTLSAGDIITGPAELTVDLDPVGAGSGINPAFETMMKLAYVMFMKDAADPASPEFSLSAGISAAVPVNLNDPVAFNIPFSSREKVMFPLYNQIKGFFALLTYDADGNLIRYSSTITS